MEAQFSFKKHSKTLKCYDKHNEKSMVLVMIEKLKMYSTLLKISTKTKTIRKMLQIC